MNRILLILSLMFCFVQMGQAHEGCNHAPGESHDHVIKLFYMPTCPHSMRVLGYLDKIHKTVPMVNVKDNPQGKEDLRRQGGLMQVPCLIIDNKPLYNDEEIIKWLSQHEDQLDDI